MIACLAKNHRAHLLFAELAKLDPRYRDLGVGTISKKALLKGALHSLSGDLRAVKLDARRSREAYASLTASCQELLDTADEPIESVLYWGATNWPMDRTKAKLPFSIVTDGPFDPDDPTYPVEWIPRKWPQGYLEFQRELFLRAQRIFTLSDWARNKILAIHPVPPEKVVRIGWGPLACMGPALTLPKEGEHYFLSVGTEWARKSMDLIAEAGSALHREFPHVRTLLVGKPDGLKIPPMPGVELVPHETPLPVVQALMRQASALIVASRFDASPHVIYEALQYGTPVIGTRVCGIPEAIHAPDGGIVIETPKTDLIESAMRQILTSPQTALRAAARGVYERSGGWGGCAQIVHASLSELELSS